MIHEHVERASRCPTCGDYAISGTQAGFLARAEGGFASGRFIDEGDGKRWLSSRITDEMLDYPDCRPVRELSDFGDSLPEWLKELIEKREVEQAAKPKPDRR